MHMAVVVLPLALASESARTEHVEFSPGRQTLIASTAAKHREVLLGESHEG